MEVDSWALGSGLQGILRDWDHVQALLKFSERLGAGCLGTRLGCLIHFEHGHQPCNASGGISMGTMAVEGIP